MKIAIIGTRGIPNTMGDLSNVQNTWRWVL